MGGVYLATYTATYPATAELETGYVVPSVRFATGFGFRPRGAVLGNRFGRSDDQDLWRRIATNFEAQSFVKRNGVWTAHRGTPPPGDRVLLGGYAERVTLAELDELLAAGLITSDERNAAIAAGQG